MYGISNGNGITANNSLLGREGFVNSSLLDAGAGWGTPEENTNMY